MCSPRRRRMARPRRLRRPSARGRIESIVRKVTGKATGGIKLNGIDDVLVRYAKCCNPLPGDQIIGFITRGRGSPSTGGVSEGVRHRPGAARRNLVGFESEDQPACSAEITTANRPGILATVGQTFSGAGINISKPIVGRATMARRSVYLRSTAPISVS